MVHPRILAVLKLGQLTILVHHGMWCMLVSQHARTIIKN